MKFFLKKDFSVVLESLWVSRQQYQNYISWQEVAELAADLANAKLEREGKVVYGKNTTDIEGNFLYSWTSNKYEHLNSHKALLINIEPIEQCAHPVEKVKCIGIAGVHTAIMECECGARVRVAKFEVCE